jgi:hypothetical protein
MWSTQHLCDRIAMHIGQPFVPPMALECQFGVVDTQAMKDRGVQVAKAGGGRAVILGDPCALASLCL